MLRFSKVIALNSDLETSQAFVFTRNTAIEGTPSQTYLAILISGVGENVFTKVRQAVTDLNDSFFDSPEPISKRLDDGLNTLKEKLGDLEDLEILISAWRIPSEESPQEHSANALFIENLGNQKVLLSRGEELIDVLQTGGEGQLISGYLKSGDRLLFLNQTLYQFFIRDGQEDNSLRKILQGPVEDLEEEVNAAVLKSPQSPPLAAILVHYHNPLLDIPEPVPLPNTEIKKRFSKIPIFANRPILPKLSIPKNPKVRLIGAGVLILILIFLAFAIIHTRANAKTEAAYKAALLSAQSDYNSAQSQKDSNPDGAKQSLINSKTELESALKLKPNDSKAQDLNRQISQNANAILKINQVTDWPLFLDLNLIKSGFSTDRMSLNSGELLLLDTSQKSLVEISLSQKTNQVLAGSQQLGNVTVDSVNGDFAFAYSPDKGVVKVDSQSLKSIVAAKPDSGWGEIKDIVGFSGNIYLLDNIKNQIWKYTPTQSGYSDKTPYLKTDTKVDFSTAKRMLIDSSVWVLHTDNNIDRFTEGSPDSFSVGGLDKPIENISAFFVSSDTDNLYLIDSTNSRLVVLTKSGQYISQLTGDKFKDAQDLVVDEPNKKLYLLENNKIYQVRLP